MLSIIRKSKVYGTIFVVFFAAAALVAVGCEQQVQEPATVPATVDVTEPEPVVPTTPVPTPEPAPVEVPPAVPSTPPAPPTVIPPPPTPPEVPDPEPIPVEPEPEPEPPPEEPEPEPLPPRDIETPGMSVPAPDQTLMLVLTEKYSEPEYGIELSYPSNWTIGSGNKAQPFDVELAGRVFIIPSEGTVGAETRVSIAFDNLSDRIDALAELGLLVDLAHSLDPFSKILILTPRL